MSPPERRLVDKIEVFLFNQYDVTSLDNNPMNFNDTIIIVKDLEDFLFTPVKVRIQKKLLPSMHQRCLPQDIAR